MSDKNKAGSRKTNNSQGRMEREMEEQDVAPTQSAAPTVSTENEEIVESTRSQRTEKDVDHPSDGSEDSDEGSMNGGGSEDEEEGPAPQRRPASSTEPDETQAIMLVMNLLKKYPGMMAKLTSANPILGSDASSHKSSSNKPATYGENHVDTAIHTMDESDDATLPSAPAPHTPPPVTTASTLRAPHTVEPPRHKPVRTHHTVVTSSTEPTFASSDVPSANSATTVPHSHGNVNMSYANGPQYDPHGNIAMSYMPYPLGPQLNPLLTVLSQQLMANNPQFAYLMTTAANLGTRAEMPRLPQPPKNLDAFVNTAYDAVVFIDTVKKELPTSKLTPGARDRKMLVVLVKAWQLGIDNLIKTDTFRLLLINAVGDMFDVPSSASACGYQLLWKMAQSLQIVKDAGDDLVTVLIEYLVTTTKPANPIEWLASFLNYSDIRWFNGRYAHPESPEYVLNFKQQVRHLLTLMPTVHNTAAKQQHFVQAAGEVITKLAKKMDVDIKPINLATKIVDKATKRASRAAADAKRMDLSFEAPTPAPARTNRSATPATSKTPSSSSATTPSSSDATTPSTTTPSGTTPSDTTKTSTTEGNNTYLCHLCRFVRPRKSDGRHLRQDCPYVVEAAIQKEKYLAEHPERTKPASSGNV